MEKLLNEDLATNVLLAVLGAGLGFAFALLLDRVKAQRERKSISWDASLETGLASVLPDIAHKVEILYNARRVESLSLVTCHIENTGRRTVKAQRLRFSFGPDVQLLEHYLDPKPQRELGVREAEDAAEEPNEVIFLLDQLEPQQAATFRFVLDGKFPSGWTPYGQFQDEDVRFQRRGAARAQQDAEHIYPFLLFGSLALIVPAALSNSYFFGGLMELAALGARIILLVLLLPHVLPMARILAQIIRSLSERRMEAAANVEVTAKGSNVYLNTAQQGSVQVDLGARPPTTGGAEPGDVAG
ncbi:hypothetical protein [Naasia sp. SYSU D00948]|uniref:hypothetical protein n=1 Tax=Naasia sp. SYSU D00948 TaxID=2817379 RepID=UPI001B313BEA|nr:hypothetical protein [Naasia sp. SYSU D00948]